MKISFIGGGNMAEAMTSAILEKGVAQPEDIWVSDISAARLAALRGQFPVNVTESNIEAVARGEVIVLAIKPQSLQEAASEIKSHLKDGQLVISIIAGKSLATLSSALGHKPLVRAMPNLAARIGQAMTVWTAAPEVSKRQRSEAGQILAAMGVEIPVDDEDHLDRATAVSGSGPAYVFYFMETLARAAVAIGLPEELAGKLVFQTLEGSAHYAATSGKRPAELRKMVTSPGGTTEQAINVFEKENFQGMMDKAVAAAYQRARELSA